MAKAMSGATHLRRYTTVAIRLVLEETRESESLDVQRGDISFLDNQLKIIISQKLFL